jgi:hypothetical protein
MILCLFLLVACGGDQEPTDLTASEAQSTAASEADAGEAPAVVFQRATEGAASLEEWRIYGDGRVAIITPSAEGAVVVDEAQIGDEKVATLLQDLETAGFYEAAEAGERRWSEALEYVISTQVGGEWHTLALEGVTAQTSPVRLQSLGVIERFIFEEIGE